MAFVPGGHLANERKPGGAAASGWRASLARRARRGGQTPRAAPGGGHRGPRPRRAPAEHRPRNPFPPRTLRGQHPARRARARALSSPAPPPRLLPARLPRALLPGTARAFPTPVSTCPARQNSAPSRSPPRSPFTPSKHLPRHPNARCSCCAAGVPPTPPAQEPRRRPRTGVRVRLPEPRGTRPSLQETPAEGAAGEAEAVPRGAPAAGGASPLGNSAERAGFLSAARRQLEETWRCGEEEEGAGSAGRGGGRNRGASGTRDCSGDPPRPCSRAPARGGPLPKPGKGAGHPTPYLPVGEPAGEKMQAPRMAPRHPGLWFPAEDKLTC